MNVPDLARTVVSNATRRFESLPGIGFSQCQQTQHVIDPDDGEYFFAHL